MTSNPAAGVGELIIFCFDFGGIKSVRFSFVCYYVTIIIHKIKHAKSLTRCFVTHTHTRARARAYAEKRHLLVCIPT